MQRKVYQLARDLGLKQKAAGRMMNRIRAEMGKDNVLLQVCQVSHREYGDRVNCKNLRSKTTYSEIFFSIDKL